MNSLNILLSLYGFELFSYFNLRIYFLIFNDFKNYFIFAIGYLKLFANVKAGFDKFVILNFDLRDFWEVPLSWMAAFINFHFIPSGSDSSNFFPHILHCFVWAITILWNEFTEWVWEIIFRFFLQSCGGIHLDSSHWSNKVFISSIVLLQIIRAA